MTKEEIIRGLKENLCAMCAYGSQNMDTCDIRGCDNRDFIKALEQEPCEDAISRETVKTEYKRRLESSLKDESKGIDLIHLADCTRFNEFIDSIPPVNPQHCDDVVSKKEVVRKTQA